MQRLLLNLFYKFFTENLNCLKYFFKKTHLVLLTYFSDYILTFLGLQS